MIGEDIANQAETWVDVPYIHRGLTRQGCDCTGLLIGCLQELGYLRGYQLRYYPKDWNLHAMADDHIQQEIGVVADRMDVRPQRGDILLFRFGKCVAHCGIFVGRGLFIHSHVRAGKVEYGTLRTVAWIKRLIAVWRLNPEKLEVTR